MRLRPGQWLFRLTVAICLVFLLGPAVAVVLMSFSDASFLSLPPRDWGVGQYDSLAESERWKTVTCAAWSAIAGTSCIAEAPVPTTATCLPVRSMLESYAAVWLVASWA